MVPCHSWAGALLAHCGLLWHTGVTSTTQGTAHLKLQPYLQSPFCPRECVCRVLDTIRTGIFGGGGAVNSSTAKNAAFHTALCCVSLWVSETSVKSRLANRAHQTGTRGGETFPEVMWIQDPPTLHSFVGQGLHVPQASYNNGNRQPLEGRWGSVLPCPNPTHTGSVMSPSIHKDVFRKCHTEPDSFWP